MNHVVSVAELKISASLGDGIITHALGSCLGISVHDPVAGIGGLLHAMLPDSSVDRKRGTDHPCTFVDTGLVRLFRECYRSGASKERLVVKVAGGAVSHGGEEEDAIQIGRRNFVMLRQVLWRNGVLLRACDVGGSDCRSMRLDVGTGTVLLMVNGAARTL